MKKSVEENRRLSESVGKRNRAKLFDDTGRAKLLLEINNAVVSNLDLRELLKTVSICLKQIINHDFAVLFLYDADAGQLRAHALHSQTIEATVAEGYLLPTEKTISGLAFTSSKTLLFSRADLERFPSTLMLTMPHTERVQSGCSVPLISRGQTLGALTLISFKEKKSVSILFPTASLILLFAFPVTA